MFCFNKEQNKCSFCFRDMLKFNAVETFLQSEYSPLGIIRLPVFYPQHLPSVLSFTDKKVRRIDNTNYKFPNILTLNSVFNK